VEEKIKNYFFLTNPSNLPLSGEAKPLLIRRGRGRFIDL